MKMAMEMMQKWSGLLVTSEVAALKQTYLVGNGMIWYEMDYLYLLR